MPNHLISRGDRVLLAGVGAVLLLLVVIADLFPGSDVQSELPTTYAAGSAGAKAAYLLLQSSGYRVERWERSPSELPDPAISTLILADPFEAPTHAELEAVQQFLARGGRVIATGVTGSLFLGNTPFIDPTSTGTWRRVRALSPSAITRAAPAITLVTSATWNADIDAVPLYGDADETVVARVSVGKGDALWWASTTPLSNAGLREPGNVEFLLACIGPAAGRRVLWDEYFHGYRHSLAASMWRSPVKWLLLQFGVLAFAVLATYARRSGPIVPLAVQPRRSTLEFVRTLGSLYQHAGAAAVAVDIGYQRFRYWLTRRLSVPVHAPAEDLVRAVRGRPGLDADAFGATLRACEAAKDDVALSPAAALTLLRSLGAYAVTLRLFAAPAKEKQ